MKRVLFFGLFLFFGAGAGAQFPVEVDSFYVFLKYNSILRDRVDWEEVDERFYREIQQAESLDDTMKCFVSVLESLGDVHSQIYLNNRYYGHYPEFDEATLKWLRPLNDRAIAHTNKIRAEVLEKNIAYLLVPGFQAYDGEQINRLGQELRDQVDRLAMQKRVAAFIIDLRLNGGGNIYPMLAGLSPLLGDKTIGYETGIGGEVVRKWEIQDGNFVIGGSQTTQVSGKTKPRFQTIPVAVLIGPVTKSSGSMVAIAFKGRPNTILIGEPTAEGYTTSNGYFQFAPNLFLNFATTFVADRNMNIYKDAVHPDFQVSRGDNFDDLMQDRKVGMAIKYFGMTRRFDCIRH